MARPEQTEKPTPKRRREARAKGQVPRSPDIGSAAIFIAIITALHANFRGTIAMAAHGFQIAFEHLYRHDDVTIRSVWGQFAIAGMPFVALLAMVFISALVIGLVANILQFGLLFAPSLLRPSFAKLNPIAGFQRILISKRTLVNLGKQLLKLGVVMLIVYMGVKDQLGTFIALAHAGPMDLVLTVEGIVYGIGIRFGILLLILGLADYAFERKQLEDSLKMSKTEVKDEQKQSEGSPESRQAIRQRQRASARRRMMAAVPRATVVVTNPTHFAVALEWDEVTMAAPVLVAKGADLIAKRIREIAAEHNVPVMQNPPLARTLYEKVPLDSPVPPNLYAAVAQVIAFVYRLKNRTIA